MRHIEDADFLGAALLPAAARAQVESDTSNVVGYETIHLAGYQINPVGLRLHGPCVVSGTITGLSGTVAGDSNADFDDKLASGTTYILEITSGVLAGAVQEVTRWGAGSGHASHELVTPQDLASLDVAVGDEYTLRAAPTLGQVFGTATSTLTRGATPATADIVWIPNGAPGGFDRYFLSLRGVWKNASNNADATGLPLIYLDGMLVQKRGPASDLTVSGSFKTTDTLAAVSAGFNLLGTIYPAGSTMHNSGLAQDLLPGFTADTADVVWVPDGTGGYARYFLNPCGVWIDAANHSAVTRPIDMTSAIWIERKGGTANFELISPRSPSCSPPGKQESPGGAE